MQDMENSSMVDYQGLDESLGGKYFIGRIIGQGAFGTVRKVQCKFTSEHYAVKIVIKEKFQKHQHRRIWREAKILSSLNHPNIVKFREIEETPEFYFIVMELIQGGSLKNFYKKRKKSHEKITEEEAAKVMKRLISAILYLHKRDIIHRDIKPDNILIKDPNDLNTIKLADFGLSAEFKEPDDSSWKQKNCGTTWFMAPELLVESQYSKPVDIWACGITMYIVLHKGRHPFFHDKDYKKGILEKLKKPKIKFRRDMSKLAKDLFKKLIALDPAKRYTANESHNHP